LLVFQKKVLLLRFRFVFDFGRKRGGKGLLKKHVDCFFVYLKIWRLTDNLQR